jgi:hypothetical protein
MRQCCHDEMYLLHTHDEKDKLTFLSATEVSAYGMITTMAKREKGSAKVIMPNVD